jgi:hypothetical protein
MKNEDGKLSRREFLKLGGVGLLGLGIPSRPLYHLSSPHREDAPSLQGRITTDTAWSYDSPSNKGKHVKVYWRDLVVNIDHTAIDEDTTAYNRIWYKLMEGGYLYSGGVQPVRTILNEPLTTYPKLGALGEISVPYTDAHESPDPASRVIYRLYYETTHWAFENIKGADGEPWARLLDDKYEAWYFIPARHLRILPREELEPISPSVRPRDKRIEVRLDAQLVVAYEGYRAVFAARAATGAILQVGTYTTPIGRYQTYHKRPSRHMAAGDITASGFDLPGVPWVLYIKDNGISLHGTYWHNDFGRPRSHGCVNLSPAAAKWLYRWSLPSVPPEKQYKYEFANATRVDVMK